MPDITAHDPAAERLAGIRARGGPPRPFLDVLLGHAGNPPLPDGYDTWGFKITRPDLRTYNGFRWPWPGGGVEDPAAVAGEDPCPTEQTGGYCVALTLAGATSGGYGHATVLLLAYRQADILALSGSDGKLRVRAAYVADVIDGAAAVRKAGHAYLRGADLQYAYLRGADLQGADLQDAHLQRSQLSDRQHTQITGTPAWLETPHA
jgi:Pentapeptide repeats (8 copies)